MQARSQRRLGHIRVTSVLLVSIKNVERNTCVVTCHFPRIWQPLARLLFDMRSRFLKNKKITGTYSATMGATTCAACPAYSTAPPESSAATACTCIAGSSGLNGGPTCNLCVEGKHQANIGSEVCDDCVAGKWLADSGRSDSADCIACGRGKYSIQAGAISEGTCDVCASGKYLDSEGNDAESDCDHCPANCGNNPAASTASSDCKCNSGSSGPDGGLCTECVAGTYTATRGNASCQSCPANSDSSAGSITITACTCNAGSTGPVEGGGPCTQCVAGKYKIASGDAACSNCLPGQYSTAVGATSDVCQGCPSNSDVGHAQRIVTGGNQLSSRGTF